jgi:hypothetical protein
MEGKGMDEETDSGAPLIALIVLFVGAAFITVGAVFLTYGLYVLIRTGAWPDYPVSKMLAEIGLPVPQAAWLDWLLASSACAVLLATGAAIAAFGAWLVARYNKRRRAAAAAATRVAAT